jgi:hypothetical protein
MEARAACADGRANDALALYDGLVAELESVVSTEDSKARCRTLTSLGTAPRRRRCPIRRQGRHPDAEQIRRFHASRGNS